MKLEEVLESTELWDPYSGTVKIDDLDVQIKSFFVLFTLAVKDGPFGVAAKDVADALDTSTQCASNHLRRLKDMGLAEEDEANHEKRASRWHLSEKLRRQIDDIINS